MNSVENYILSLQLTVYQAGYSQIQHVVEQVNRSLCNNCHWACAALAETNKNTHLLFSQIFECLGYRVTVSESAIKLDQRELQLIVSKESLNNCCQGKKIALLQELEYSYINSCNQMCEIVRAY